MFKIAYPANQMVFMYTFVITAMESGPHQIIRFYCECGKMENFIKESKNGFDFSAVSNSSMPVNANRLQLHLLAYNLFNWLHHLALTAKMKRLQIDAVHLKFLKITARVARSARHTTFTLCSGCPHKSEFSETLQNIQQLQPQLE